MYAYVDEAGNTGKNLFDKAQPTFVTAALISREDFDISWPASVRRLADTVGLSVLHANKLDLEKTEQIASDILDIFRRMDASFFVSRVDKMFLATTKAFDTIFDSGENLAVPWQSYNVRPLRLLLMFKFCQALDEDLVKRFWACLMKTNEAKAYRDFVSL